MGTKTGLCLVFMLSALFIVDGSVEGSSPSEGLFEQGPFDVDQLQIATWESSMLVAVPNSRGTYPVLVFIHGYVPLRNNFYWDLCEQVASHGYIVVAPLLYDFTGWDATKEMIDTAAILDWLNQNLYLQFPARLRNVNPDFTKLALAGHSRGGKVAFGVAVGLISRPAVNLSALAAFDPVDGAGNFQNPPPLLTYLNSSFDLNIPTLLVGTGLGSKRSLILPPCAPENLGHREFFLESPAPSYHFVASDYGVNDVLNDDLFWLSCLLCRCRLPPSLAPMRRFAAGVLVAFLRSAMADSGEALEDILKNPDVAPVRLEPPQYKVVPAPPVPAPAQAPEVVVQWGGDLKPSFSLPA